MPALVLMVTFTLPDGIIYFHKLSLFSVPIEFKGQLGVPLTVYPWYFLCSLEILGIITHQHPLYRAYIGISHRGTLAGVHPNIP